MTTTIDPGTDAHTDVPVDRDRRSRRWTIAALAFVAYVPLLLTKPGTVSADTKAYLLLDPGRLLGRASWMWDTHVGAGTVTHQNIGYLFPMAPYYWVMSKVGVPVWLAERVWFGSLLFLAGLGMWWMLRRLGLRGIGTAVGAFMYMTTPYILPYMGRMSVILTPWSALPWLIGLTAVALRERTWRAPAIIGLVVTVMAGTNASSVVFALIGPALLVPYMLWGTREIDLRPALRAIVRIAVVTIPAQLWWVAGLYTQGKFGLPILQLTETVETVSETSTASEIVRGMGYWVFYGRDGLTNWIDSAPIFTQNDLMLGVGFVLPLLSLLAAMVIRWKYRIFFLSLVLIGLLLAIGAYPYDDPSVTSGIFKAVTANGIGFALRSSPRAVPLLVLGMAALLAAAVEPVLARLATVARSGRTRTLLRAVPYGLIAVAILGLPPLWQGGLVQKDLSFPSDLPTYWQDAAATLDSGDPEARVLELPGADFYAYNWGDTQDPITPGIIDRPWVGRELTAFGTPASVDLVRALDRRLQEGVADPAAIAPVARLLSASDVLLRMDTQYSRYRSPRPGDLWTLMGRRQGLPELGLPAPEVFGPESASPSDPRQPTVDEAELARTQAASVTPPLAIYSIEGARPMLRAEPKSPATVVWGDGDGVVDAAELGLVPGDTPIFYAPTVHTTPSLLDGLTVPSTSLVVTDTNRRRAQRWGTIRENNGATEAAGSTPLQEDPKDERLDMFPGITDDQRTVAWYGPDVADVRATTYGNVVAYSAEARAINAIDGDPRTAWTTGGYSDVVGDRLRIDLAHPVTADHVDLLQTQGNRFITKVSVWLDGERVATPTLGDDSFVGSGQRIDLGGEHTFSSVEVRIDAANVSGLQSYVGVSNVGIRELTIPGVSASEWIVVPSTDLAQLSGAGNPLTYVFSRWRANPVEAYRQDAELQLQRIFDVPRAEAFTLGGDARINAHVDGAVVDQALGRPGLDAGHPLVSGTTWLEGNLHDIPSAANDGDLTTSWVTPFGSQVGTKIVVTNPAPVTISSLDLAVVNDGRHSVPTALDLVDDAGTVHHVEVPALDDSAAPDTATTVHIAVDPFTSAKVEVRIAAQRDLLTTEFFGGGPHALPISIAELGLPATVAPYPAAVPSTCRTDLVTLDGAAVPVRMTGATADALDRAALPIQACDGSISLSAGSHRLHTDAGLDTGIDVDRVTFANQVPAAVTAATTTPTATPTVVPTRTGELSWEAQVSGATEPYWLVLGQSLAAGWKAKIKGGDSLGDPVLIDGFANGWYVDPAVVGPDVTVEITWAPEAVVQAGIAVSALWLVGIAVLAAVATRRRRRKGGARAADSGGTVQLFVPWAARGLASRGARVAATVTAAVVGFAVGGVAVGVVLAVATALAARWRRGHVVFPIVTILAIGAVVASYVVVQILKDYRTEMDWPTSFGPTHQLALIAVFSVAVEALLRYLARRWPASSGDHDVADESAVVEEGSAAVG
jgi:arabinofuranan 3-O-arabinosyltransferase